MCRVEIPPVHRDREYPEEALEISGADVYLNPSSGAKKIVNLKHTHIIMKKLPDSRIWIVSRRQNYVGKFRDLFSAFRRLYIPLCAGKIWDVVIFIIGRDHTGVGRFMIQRRRRLFKVYRRI